MSLRAVAVTESNQVEALAVVTSYVMAFLLVTCAAKVESAKLNFIVVVWGPSASPNTGERRASKQRRKLARFSDEAFAFFPFPVVDEDELSVFDLI